MSNLSSEQVASKAMAVGRLFSLQYDASTAFLLATAGSKGHVALWHSDEDEAISARCVLPCACLLRVRQSLVGVSNSPINLQEDRFLLLHESLLTSIQR